MLTVQGIFFVFFVLIVFTFIQRLIRASIGKGWQSMHSVKRSRAASFDIESKSAWIPCSSIQLPTHPSSH